MLEEWVPASVDASALSGAGATAADMPAIAANPTRPTDSMGNVGNAGAMAVVNPPALAAGSGAAPVPQMAAAGSGGAAGAPVAEVEEAPPEVRLRLIAAATLALAAIEAAPAGDAGEHSQDIVQTVLFSIRALGGCAGSAQECVDACAAITQDCELCTGDAGCAETVEDLCREAVDACSML
ncbi:MAG TPA: hypothetical protein VMF89_29635 [Polyangiales bacterium]|nr:hypothetical protein [Polyangiales bacterium]